MRVSVRGVGRAFVFWSAILAMGCSKTPQPSEHQDAAHVVGPTWKADRRDVYHLDLSSRLIVEGGNMVAFTLHSSLVLDARAPGASVVELAATLPDAKFEADDPEARAQLAGLAQELGRTFAFSLSKGKFSEIRIPRGWSVFAASIAQTVAAAFQFADQPTAAAGPTWTAKEQDATGSYQAEYTISSGGVITKRKLSYDPIALGKIGIANFNGKLTPEIQTSNGVVALSAAPQERQLARIEYAEKLKTPLTAKSAIVSETSLKLALESGKAPPPAVDWATIVASTDRLEAGERYGGPAPTTDYDATRIGDYTFATALRELELQARDPGKNLLFEKVSGKLEEPESLPERQARLREHGRVFTAMTALLRSDAKNVPLAVAKILAHSPAERALLDALSSAGSLEAQQGLVALMDDPKLDKAQRRAAAFSLIRTETPVPQTVSALEAHTANDDFLRIHALYGLGTFARRLREGGQAPRAVGIVSTLQDALRASETPAQQAGALRGIANSGSSTALEAVRPFLDSKHTKVRAAAVDAIRLMQVPEVDGIIADRLARGENDVQLAALDAVSVREPSDVLARALDGVARKAEKPATRLKAVRIMGNWLPKRPELKGALEAIAANDNQDRVRSAAREALGS